MEQSTESRDEQQPVKRQWEKPEVVDLTLQATGSGNGFACIPGSGNFIGCGVGTLGAPA